MGSCEHDEFSENIYVNQILKTTALLVIHSDKVEQEQKKALKKAMFYFHTVDTLNLFDIQWSKIKYHNNNATYKMLINVCYLIIETLLHTAQEGTKKLAQFKEDGMSKLFERFVLEYYRKHYPQYNATPTHIKWNVEDKFIELLPTMKSDITLEHNGKTLIIDTKYYKKTVQTDMRYNSLSIHSNNLYQIFTYVKNKDTNHSGQVNGVLLYAKTDEAITPDNSYLMDRNKISVKTLDLDRNFAEIRHQLDKIVIEWQQ